MNLITSKIITLLILAFLSLQANAIEITRLEPESWWTGMKNTRLQIMIYGPGIGNAVVSISYPGVHLTSTEKAENPNYLFVYVEISRTAKPGMMPIMLRKGAEKLVRPYRLNARTDKSGASGFDASDVLYLITPDRFANGDPGNDDLDTVKAIRTRPNSRHGGDLAGVSRRLDYLKDLGVSTIWLNPIQENRIRGGSYHGYAITDFYRVDPRFGSNSEFRSLVRDAHAKDLKMVMDMVFNHCGGSHWWMNDLPSKDWINNDGVFLQTNHATVTAMDIYASPSEKRTFLEGWFTRGMPDLNQRNPHLATYLIQNSIWWIEEMRIDGIRQDTYSYMDYGFLARWCKEVADEYPRFNIVGETWYNKTTAPAFWQRQSPVSDSDSHLRTVMNFSLTFLMQNAFDSRGDSAYLTSIFEDLAQDFIYRDPYNVLTFLDNHDMSRFVREDDTDLRRYKQGLAFLLTTRGIPQLYYGTEVLMTGTKEQGDGRLRKDFPGGWAGDSTDQFTRKGRSPMQNEAFDFLRKLLQWRRGAPAITKGKLMHYSPQDGVYVYARIYGEQRVLVLINGSRTDKTIRLDRFRDVISGYTKGTDVIGSGSYPMADSITVAAKSQLILELAK